MTFFKMYFWTKLVFKVIYILLGTYYIVSIVLFSDFGLTWCVLRTSHRFTACWTKRTQVKKMSLKNNSIFCWEENCIFDNQLWSENVKKTRWNADRKLSSGFLLNLKKSSIFTLKTFFSKQTKMSVESKKIHILHG